MKKAARRLAPALLTALCAGTASAEGAIRIAAGAPSPAANGFSALIAAEAGAAPRAAGTETRRALERRLGIDDWLDSRSGRTLTVSVSTSVVRADHVETKIRFEGPAGAFEALLLEPPRGSAGRHPAILGVPGRGRSPEEFSRLFWGPELARKGSVVLIPSLGAGAGADFDDAFNLLLLGRTLAGARVFDLILMIDYLSSLPSVDAERTAVLGEGSGSIAAVLAAAIDPRVRAVALDASVRKGPYFDFEADLLVPGLYGPISGEAVTSLIRPRPVLLEPAGYSGASGFPERLARALRGEASAAAGETLGKAVDALFKEYKAAPPGPSSGLSHFDRALKHLADRQLDRAAAELTLARKLDPDNPASARKLAAVYGLQGRRELAKEVYLRALALAPHNLGLMMGLADLSAEHEDWEAAKEWYARAARSDPGSAQAHLGLAYCLKKLGRSEDARRELSDVLKLDPAVFSANRRRQRAAQDALLDDYPVETGAGR